MPRKKTARQLVNIRDDNLGAVLTEFAFALATMMICVILVTDYALAILAGDQVQGAARAGVEFAATRGYSDAGSNQSGIVTAAKNALSLGSMRLSNLQVTSGRACYCVSNGSLTSAAGTVTTGGVLNCTEVCADGLNSVPYASVTVSADYAPLATSYWGSTPLTFSKTYYARTH